MVAIFTYGFDIAQTNFEDKEVALHTLSDYNNLLIKAESTNYISSSEADLLSQWRNDPATWNPES
jgi:orotate phosphoribosyltransferase